MTTAKDKFERLLRELFQFDCADLDFGIYRIMNYKRAVIEKFIATDLPRAIDVELDRGVLADQSQTVQHLAEFAKKIAETLGKDALDADGNLVEFQETEIGRKYLDLKARAAGGQSREAIETAVYNHLYTFFSRYYQDGDFISKRRYSRRQKYAIPYNGEEVYLHWANRDQYYIKTAEHFQDYRWKDEYGTTVHFRLTAANLEQNNVKGDKRFFIPCPKAMEWNAEARILTIPFEYRPLTEQEAIACGTKNQQDKIIAEAPAGILKVLSPRDQQEAVVAITTEHHKTADGESISNLNHHLRQYTRRNTSDFFIHKDLKGFLSRELDFYLKNEVLNLDEMDIAGENRCEGWFQLMRAIRSVGGPIIDFLDQIESFQKMLWEKRKFIAETQYCITVGNIDESFYPEIAACNAQWDEWKALFHIDEEQTDLFTMGKSKQEKRIAFLKAHPTLVLDTKHFAAEYVNRLLAHFNDIENLTDGLLIHSENWQALNLLTATYQESVRSIYIDPPYNTDAGPILYKNNYRSSSWISLMADRFMAAMPLLRRDSVLCATIDDYQYKELYFLLENIFGKNSIAGTVAIRCNPSGRPVPSGFAQSHEYAIFATRSPDSTMSKLPRTDKQAARYRHIDDGGPYMWELFRKRGSNSERRDRPSLFYPIYVAGESVRVPVMAWNDDDREWHVEEKPKPGEKAVYPIDEGGTERTWRGSPDNIQDSQTNFKAIETKGSITIYYKFRPSDDGILPTTMWIDAKYSATEHGTGVMKNLFTEYNVFSYPKSIFAVEDSLRVSGMSPGHSGSVCDFFAGSGTTGHAAINLNREDGCNRRFILVEMAHYFDTVLLPRIKKVSFAPEWKDGKPKRMATEEEAGRSPRIIKYMRLESYEDALNNISFDDASGQGALKFDDYLIKYMLKWETRRSETLLNIEKLDRPFNYTLIVAKGGESVEKAVDIPETFNYLLGLHVATRKVYDDGGRRYLVFRGRIDHRQVAVIWRDTHGWEKKDLERDKQFVVERKLTEGADKVFVNGDSFIPNARALEPVFKARMFAPVEA